MPKIIAKLESLWPDRTMYKPYAYNMRPQDLYVEIEVPEDTLRTDTLMTKNEKGEKVEENVTIMNLHGFTCLLGSIADEIDDMHTHAQTTKNAKNTQANQSYFKD